MSIYTYIDLEEDFEERLYYRKKLTHEEFESIEKIPEGTEIKENIHSPLCSICLEQLKELDMVLLNCNHIFHEICCKNWLVYKHNTCPMCREIVKIEKTNIEKCIENNTENNTENIITNYDFPIIPDGQMVYFYN